MNYSLYTGCTVPLRFPGYEIATMRVAETLGMNISLLKGSSCCGFPILALNQDSSFALSAINLCIAEEQGMDVVTLCNSCTSHLAKVNHIMKTDNEVFDRVSKLIRPAGYEFQGTIEVKHIARILYEDVGPQKIKEKIEVNLDGFSIAAIYGCHYLKPSNAFNEFDDPQNPKSLETLIRTTGATAVDYPERILCCGGPILAISEESSSDMSKRVLDGAKAKNPDALTVICPFCNVMYSEYQSTIGEQYGIQYDMPVFFLPQLLALGMGFKPKELRIKRKSERYRAFFKKLEEGHQ
jgi:heterodisulfide reductase subunit B2